MILVMFLIKLLIYKNKLEKMIFALHLNIWSYGMIYTVGVSGASGVEDDSPRQIFGELGLKRIDLLEQSQIQI